MVRKEIFSTKWADADQRASTGSSEARDEMRDAKFVRHGHNIFLA